MRRFAMAMLIATISLLLCSSCGKTESGDSEATSTPAAGSGAPAPAAAPAAGKVAIPPQWLLDAMSFWDREDDSAVEKVLSVEDHDVKIAEFGKTANGDQCTLLMSLVGELAYQTEDERYLDTASALSKRLHELGADDSTLAVLQAYPPEVVEAQITSMLESNGTSTLDLCGIANWMADWHERQPGSVAGLLDSSESQLRAIFADSLLREDRDHGVLGITIVSALRRCDRVGRDESLRMLDQWQAQYGQIDGFASLHSRIRKLCERPDQ